MQLELSGQEGGEQSGHVLAVLLRRAEHETRLERYALAHQLDEAVRVVFAHLARVVAHLEATIRHQEAVVVVVDARNQLALDEQHLTLDLDVLVELDGPKGALEELRVEEARHLALVLQRGRRRHNLNAHLMCGRRRRTAHQSVTSSNKVFAKTKTFFGISSKIKYPIAEEEEEEVFAVAVES